MQPASSSFVSLDRAPSVQSGPMQPVSDGRSIYSQYAPPPRTAGSPQRRRSKSSRGSHQTTRSAALRASGVRLCCYLNSEVDRGRSTIVQLPADCDTIAEVLPKIQQKMQLDKRMLFIAELFLPTGDLIRSWSQLVEASRSDSPIIIGCGEPFDPLRVPNALLELHLNGGGRNAVKVVNAELKDKRHRDRQDRAETVRQAGHGVFPEAAAVSRWQHAENNRGTVNIMRQQYMEGLAYSAAQQQELLDSVYNNVAYQKMEAEESKVIRAEIELERREKLAVEREQQAEDLRRAREHAQSEAVRRHDAVKFKDELEGEGGGWW